MFEVKPISTASPNKIREIIDIYNANLRALNSLNRPSRFWDDMIIYMICQRLDPVSRQKWDDECDPEKIPELEELMKFLNRRCHNLEDVLYQTTYNNVPVKNKSPTLRKSTVMTIYQITCAFCSKIGHYIHRCTKFRTQSLNSKKLFLKKANLCYNCLKANHITENCPSPYTCNICSQKHHTILHEYSKARQHSNQTAPSATTITEVTPQHNMIVSTASATTATASTAPAS